MPSFVDNNLVRDEVVVYRAKIHWSIFLSPFIILIIPLITRLTAYLTTEMAVTSRRVIGKKGLIKRETLDLNHTRVESVVVNQGILGSIFNSGSIEVRGTGGSSFSFMGISSPMEFRRQALEQIDERNQ